LQVIPRRLSSAAPMGSVTTGRILLPPPARRRRLRRVVVGTVTACGLILIAAVSIHLARPNQDATAFAATTTTAIVPPTASAPGPAPSPVAAAVAAPPAEVPETGTVDLQRPATAGHVWLDGQKLSAASATVSCGKHQIKVGARGRAHAIDIPCGGEIRVSH
jgi:hypothetical protein